MNEEQVRLVVAFGMSMALAFFFFSVNLRAGRSSTKRVSFYAMILSAIVAIACTVGVLK